MKISYDSRYNIAYIHFREKVEPVQTVSVSDELNVDLAPDGKIYGIELLNANQQLALNGESTFVFVNEAAGSRHEVCIEQ